jgi:hypothetical protein
LAAVAQNGCHLLKEDATTMTVTACFDAAGKAEDKGTPIIAVAGFSSVTSVWADFERQ